MSGTPGAFLDRDGTIIRDYDYLRDPDRVELLPGSAAAIERLNVADVTTVIVTNQSGIARGLVTEAEYEKVRRRLDALLAEHGARVADSYHCPHHPDYTGACECRKPGLLLYQRAIARHDIDPARSLFVGDRWRDVHPGLALGGFAALIPNEVTPSAERARAEHDERVHIVSSLADAVDRFLAALPTLPASTPAE